MKDIVEEHLDNCSKSFLYFVEKELLAIPSNQQLEAIQAVQDAVDKKAKPYISIRSGHGTGKTSFLAWLILWVGLTKYDAKLPTTAPVAAQLTNLLIPEVNKWKFKMSDDLQKMIEVQILMTVTLSKTTAPSGSITNPGCDPFALHHSMY